MAPTLAALRVEQPRGSGLPATSGPTRTSVRCGFAAVRIGEEKYFGAVVGAVTVLHQVTVGRREAEVVRDAVLFAHGRIPCVEIVAFGPFEQDETLRVAFELFDPVAHLPVAPFVIDEAERFGRVTFDAEDAAALLYERIELFERSRLDAFDTHQEEGAVLFRAVAQLAVFDRRAGDHAFRRVIASAAVFMVASHTSEV